jgi:hypothetical protein
MAGHAERLFISRTADGGDQIGARRIAVQRMIGAFETRPLQNAANIFRTRRFVAGRVDGLEWISSRVSSMGSIIHYA